MNPHDKIFLSGVLTAFLLLPGCAVQEKWAPAPVLQLGAGQESPYGTVTARAGDTVWKIAQRYNATLRDVIDVNGLAPPYALRAGQRLKMPPPLEHKVGKNDTLYSVSRMYAAPLSQLVRVNDLQAPYVLEVGQVIRIPSSVVGQQQAEIKQQVIPAWRETTPAARVSGLSKERDAQAYAPPAFSSAPSSSVAQVEQVPLPPPEKQAASTAGVLSDKAVVTVKRAPSPLETTVMGSGRPDFTWPLRGKIISSYGPKSGKLYNDGINIAAPRGTPVVAAADGVVAYVGNDLGSYGNLVLLRHSGGMVTAYAHMADAAVAKDAVVRKGQAIGRVGSTGNVSNTQLHFEVRQGTKTFDPVSFLK